MTYVQDLTAVPHRKRGSHRRSLRRQLLADLRDLANVVSIEATVFAVAVVALVGFTIGASL